MGERGEQEVELVFLPLKKGEVSLHIPHSFWAYALKYIVAFSYLRTVIPMIY